MPTLEPTLADVISRAVASRLLDVHTALPATVVAYYAADHTADVQIGPARAVPTVDGEVSYEVLPPIPKVPVLAFGTERSFLQTPLQPGDCVWLLAGETSAAEFLDGSDVTQPGDLSRFSLSSCVAIPFVRPGKATGAARLALLSDVQALITALNAATAGGSPLTYVPPTITGTAEIKCR